MIGNLIRPDVIIAKNIPLRRTIRKNIALNANRTKPSRKKASAKVIRIQQCIIPILSAIRNQNPLKIMLEKKIIKIMEINMMLQRLDPTDPTQLIRPH